MIARQQADAVELERVERVGDLLQAAVDVGQRKHGKAAEAAGMVGDQLGGIFVALARELARRLSGGEIDAGCRHREHRDRDAGLVHIGERAFGGPFPHWTVAETGPYRGRDIARRRQMMVDVDAVGFWASALGQCILRTAQTGRRKCRGSRHSGHELASAQGRACERDCRFAPAHTTFERPAWFANLVLHLNFSLPDVPGLLFLIGLPKFVIYRRRHRRQ